MPSYRLNPEARRIVLPAKVTGPAGSQMVDMMLDTGASVTTLSHEVALAVGLDPARATQRIEIMTASSIEMVPLIVVPAVTVLGQRVKRLEVVCHDLPPVSPVEGLLGLNFLKEFNLHLNFRKGTLELLR